MNPDHTVVGLWVATCFVFAIAGAVSLVMAALSRRPYPTNDFPPDKFLDEGLPGIFFYRRKRGF